METPQGTPHDSTITTTTATATSVHRSAWQPSWEKGGRKGKPRARSNLWVWVVSALILSVLFVPLGLLAFRIADNVPVFDAAKQFCVAEEQGSYSAAYDLLSDRVQQTVNETQFGVASQQTHIADCSPLQNGASFNALGSSVTLRMSYSVPVNPSSSANPAPNHFVTDDQGTMRLVHDSDGWRVDAVTTSLFTLF